jgi:hypothetical protein
MLHASFILGLFFIPEDGDDKLLQNTDWPSADYTAVYPIR